MDKTRLENIVGALSLAISGEVLQASQESLDKSLPSAAIALIGHLPGITIQYLGHALSLSHPGTVRAVDRLESEGLVIRQRSAEDGRAVSLTLSRKGEKACRTLHASRQSVLCAALSNLSKSERQHLERIACKVLVSILKDEPHALRVCRLCDVEACKDCPIENEITRREQEAESG